MRCHYSIPRSGLVLVLILAALAIMLTVYPTAGAADKTDREAADAYKKAYEMILSKEYAKAQKAFAEYMEAYRGSRWYDDARYWYCYALMESTNNLEKAFQCYREFIESHPHSEYLERAEENAVLLAKKLSTADPTYKKYIQELHASSEDEIDQALILALVERGDENTIVELLHDTKDPDMRRWLVYALGDCKTVECKEKLIEIAKTDPDPDIRRHAIFAVAEFADEVERVSLMIEILDGEKDPDIRRHALWMIAESKDPAAVSKLIDIALTEKDPDMARAATYAIADTDDPGAKDALERLIRESKDSEVKRAALYGLIDDAGPDALDTLKDIALTDRDSDLRRAAVWAIAEMRGDEAAAAALAEIFGKSKDNEVRRAALYGMANFDEDISVELLKQAALTASDEELAKAGMYALVDVIRGGDIEIVMEIYEKTPYPDVRRAALHVILDAGRGEALPLLTKILKTETDSDIRLHAVYALADAGDDDEIVEILADVARNDRSNRVRHAAIQVLGKIDTEAAHDALLEIFKERRGGKGKD